MKQRDFSEQKKTFGADRECKQILYFCCIKFSTKAIIVEQIIVFVEEQKRFGIMDGNDMMSEQPITSNSGQNMSGSGRKRGHQHHIRHSGTRTSNVRAEEVIAALRRGDQLPVTIPQYIEPTTDLPDDNLNDNKICDSSSTTDQNGNNSDRTRNNTLIADVLNKNIRLRPKNANISIDSTNEQLNETNVISRDSDDWSETTAKAASADTVGALHSSDIDMESMSKDELNDSISSGSSSGSKSKSKRSKKVTDGDTGAKKEKRSKRVRNLPRPPSEERPPLEGAAADQWTENDGTVDTENDPEADEWSKLRCTSERTEVVAEREYRRQNRRCADYPGLAFGRSIFSSDTMMKLNIIRNELHNIMKTQLKRVCVTVATDDGYVYYDDTS